MSAGWLGLLKHYHIYIPTTIYGVLAIIFATLAMALPETKGEKIPDTLEEGEQGWISKHLTWYFNCIQYIVINDNFTSGPSSSHIAWMLLNAECMNAEFYNTEKADFPEEHVQDNWVEQAD